tara:strand:+ start:203 stop:421 length:219 start_codon:yes stop_codon:yes gene_type:complete
VFTDHLQLAFPAVLFSFPTIVPALQSAIAMDEIAPEYDVVVLGTGRTRPRMEGQSRESHDMRGFKLIHNAQV